MAGGRDRFLAEMRALDGGFDVEVVRTFPEGTRTAQDAAAAIGCATRAIVKSLVFVADDRPAMFLVNGASRADEGHLQRAMGAGSVRRADAAEVRRHTGYAIGGTPPTARVGALPRWLDRTLLDLDVVWCAAGTPHDVFPIGPERLVALTGATATDLVAS